MIKFQQNGYQIKDEIQGFQKIVKTFNLDELL